jgi:hypothetical protein
MHTLHSYLVKLSPLFGDYDYIQSELKNNHTNFQDEVLQYVLDKTDNDTDLFDASNVYDWRENGPGRWADIYPPVLFGAIDKHAFIEEFKYAINAPHRALIENFAYLKEYIQTNSTSPYYCTDDNTVTIKLSEQFFEDFMCEDVNRTVLYKFKCIASILGQEYSYLVPYYDLVNYTILTPEETKQDVYANPENYALVFIDCHF